MMKMNWIAVIGVALMSAGVGMAQVALVDPNDIVTWHVDTVVAGGLHCHLADDGFTATACHLQEGTLDDAVTALLRANKVTTTNLTDEREAYDRLLQRFNKFLEQIMAITAPSGNAKTATPKPQPKPAAPKAKPAAEKPYSEWTPAEQQVIIRSMRTYGVVSQEGVFIPPQVVKGWLNPALDTLPLDMKITNSEWTELYNQAYLTKPSCGPNAPQTVLGDDGMCRVAVPVDLSGDHHQYGFINIHIGPDVSHCNLLGLAGGKGNIECSWKAEK